MNYAAALCYFPKFSVNRARRLFSFFKNAEEIWKAELEELCEAGLDPTIAHELMQWRESFSVEKITAELELSQIKTTSIVDAEYPALLKEISDPPSVIFYRGCLPAGNQPAISIVGTRRCTAYGKKVTEEIVAELASNGVAIVSGLALGIDGIAHAMALKNNSLTFAVLGSGVDHKTITPTSHLLLAKEIIETGGGIISEYPPGFKPTPYSFPARNRIIAGLTRGTLITEAPLASGALITAARCLDYNREIFVIPHPITSLMGKGGNEFIKKGAQLVTSAADILAFLNLESLKSETNSRPLPENELEEQIYAAICNEPKHIDELIKITKIPAGNLTGTLTMLELKAKVQNMGGMTYQWA